MMVINDTFMSLRRDVRLCHYEAAMGMMKNYLLNLLQQCSEEKFGQDAIEWAIVSGRVRLTYDLEHDIHETMSRYDEIIEAYRRSPAQAMNVPVTMLAPMERATPGRRAKAADSKASARKKRAA
jgi:hypothetical protein